jgi:PAS domain S-box-containing protein
VSAVSRTNPNLVNPIDLWEIAESIPHLVWMSTPDGTTEHLNRRAVEYIGGSAESWNGRRWIDLIHPDDAARAQREWARAVGANTTYEIDCRLRRHDGVYRWHTFRSMPRHDPDGSVVRWIGTATDIDDRKRFEDQLWRSERGAAETLSLLETLLSTAPVGLGFVDRDCRLIRLNQMLARVSGTSVEAQLGRPIADVVPEVWSQIEPAIRRVLDTGESVLNVDVSTEYAERPGRVQHALASYYPVRLEGEIIGVGMVVVDITGRYEAEAARNDLMRSAIGAIAATIDARDPYTAGHQRRVGAISAAIATQLGLEASETEGVRLAATIHDIGKIGVPAEILTRPGELRAEERALLKVHPRTGYDIVAGIDFPWPIAQMVLQHHERLDGSGYPEGLRGDEILLGARIIAVADTVEAMSAARPYRSARGLEAALDEIRAGRGTRYDADVVDACVELAAQGRLPLDEPQGSTAKGTTAYGPWSGPRRAVAKGDAP